MQPPTSISESKTGRLDDYVVILVCVLACKRATEAHPLHVIGILMVFQYVVHTLLFCLGARGNELFSAKLPRPPWIGPKNEGSPLYSPIARTPLVRSSGRTTAR